MKIEKPTIVYWIIIVTFVILASAIYNTNYTDKKSSLATANSNEQVKLESATPVEVRTYDELKQFLNSSDSYELHIQNNIFITDTIVCNGKKTIYGYNNFLNNSLENFSDSNQMIIVSSDSTLDMHNVIMDGANKPTISSSNITVDGTLNIYDCTFHNGSQGIHVAIGGTLFFHSGDIATTNSNMGIGSYGNVTVSGGTITSGNQCIHNNGGTLNITGGIINGGIIGVRNINDGTATISGGDIRFCTQYGIYNDGQLVFTNGNIYQNIDGIYNMKNKTAMISGGNIYQNDIGIRNDGILTVSNGTIKENKAENGSAIYQNGTCTITGGTLESNQNVYLAADDKFVYTNNNYPMFTIKPNTYTRGRLLVRTSTSEDAIKEIENVNLVTQDKWLARNMQADIVIWDKGKVIVKYQDKVGNTLKNDFEFNDWVGEIYETNEVEIPGYSISQIPSNASGTYSQQDTTVLYVYSKQIGKVKIVYIDEDGNELLKDSLEGMVGSKYVVKQNEIKNYKLKEVQGDIEGIFELEEKTVTFIMQKISGKVTVNIIDEDNNTLDTLEQYGLVGEEYNIELPKIDGYYYDGYSILSGSFEEGEKNITIKYKKDVNVPDTSDINVLLYLAIAILCLVLLIRKIKKAQD